MITLYNIIGCIFMGLTAYFLWAIEGWLLAKTLVAFFVGLTFITIAQTMQKEKCIENYNGHDSYSDILDQINKSKTKWETHK